MVTGREAMSEKGMLRKEVERTKWVWSAVKWRGLDYGQAVAWYGPESVGRMAVSRHCDGAWIEV